MATGIASTAETCCFLEKSPNQTFPQFENQNILLIPFSHRKGRAFANRIHVFVTCWCFNLLSRERVSNKRFHFSCFSSQSRGVLDVRKDLRGQPLYASQFPGESAKAQGCEVMYLWPLSWKRVELEFRPPDPPRSVPYILASPFKPLRHYALRSRCVSSLCWQAVLY